MVKRTWIIACTLLFVSVAGIADSPSPAPVSNAALAAILGETEADRSCQTPSGVRLATVQGEKGIIKLDCGNSIILEVNCQGSGSFVQRNCSINERGHIWCDGAIASCPPC